MNYTGQLTQQAAAGLQAPERVPYGGNASTSNKLTEIYSVGSGIERLKQLSNEQSDLISRIVVSANSLTGSFPPKDTGARPAPVPNCRVDELRELVSWFEANNSSLALIADALSRGV